MAAFAQIPTIQIVVLAHNEERRIAGCLDSLPIGAGNIRATVVVNGSSDGTADIVRSRAGDRLGLVEYEAGGKSRSWNRYVLEEAPLADFYVFVDGDAELLPGSVDALVSALRQHPQANAASGVPMNGRRARQYQTSIVTEFGMFGDCYALTGSFIGRLRSSGIRLPDDLIGDDGLIRALACTDLGPNANWKDKRIVPCLAAGFLCEPNSIGAVGLRQQSRRMINYAERHWQNQIVKDIMQAPGPTGLPNRLAELYPDYLPRFRPRLSPLWYWFDRQALARMQEQVDRSLRAPA